MRTDTEVVVQPLPAAAVLPPSIWPTILPPLVYAFASIFVPYLGWLAGAALIATSWRLTRTAKLLSTLAPLVAAAIWVVVVSAISGGSPTDIPVGPSISTFFGVIMVDTLFSSYFVVGGASFIAGIWLLAVALRRIDRHPAVGTVQV
jgi:hypothetical protein